jgi:endo-1,4-beta-xylanase
MQSFAPFVLLAVFASSALAATPTVSLLIDNGYASTGTLNLRSTLQQVSTLKGGAFHFGSTYETYSANQTYMTNVFSLVPKQAWTASAAC